MVVAHRLFDRFPPIDFGKLGLKCHKLGTPFATNILGFREGLIAETGMQSSRTEGSDRGIGCTPASTCAV
jgi:hypothetical protein